MKIRKTLISAAGFGSRRLPVSKAIQKEMLPYLNRPMVDYIVDACIDAGIEEIILVVRPHSNQVREFYSQDIALEEYLKEKGKNELLEELRILHKKAVFTFVNQNKDDGYGTGVPLKVAKPYLEDEVAFLYVGGDDYQRGRRFFYQGTGR